MTVRTLFRLVHFQWKSFNQLAIDLACGMDTVLSQVICTNVNVHLSVNYVDNNNFVFIYMLLKTLI
jgi:hypothetical protein